MASALAIVSKAVFEKQAPGAEVGAVVAMERYAATPKQLEALADGGALFLVTVRPPDEQLWLVAVLEDPAKKGGAWLAKPNVVAIRDISALKTKLVFENGKGLPSEAGKLGMSLQTPRVLTDADVALLRAGKAKPQKTTVKPAPAPKKQTVEKPAAVVDGGAKAIQAAIKDKDPAAALAAALSWWRATKNPDVADLIDSISTKFTTPAITDQPTWTKHAMSRDPRIVRALVAALPAMPVSFLPTAADLLAKFPDDPRLAMATAGFAEDPITTSSSTYAFWSKSIEAMIRIGDIRTLAKLRARTKKKPGDSQFWPKFYAALKKAIAKIDAIQPVDAEVDAVANQLKQLPAQQVGLPAVSAGAKRASGKPLLEQALAQLAADDVAPAIASMVERWREVRAPALADTIDRASRQLPSYDRPVLSPAWEELFEKDANAAMPQLLLNLHAGTGKEAEIRLAALATLPDDPRISLRLAALCHGRHSGPERTQYWRAMYDLLARHRDHRTVGPLRAEHCEFTNTYYDNHRQAKRIIGPFCLNPGEPPALDKADTAVLTKIAAALGKREAKQTDEAALLDAIAAEWKADAPRLVYADWLQEREHPRGELIALSLREGKHTKPEAQRFRELLGIAYLHGEFTDVAAYSQQALDRGLWRELHTDYRAGTLLVRACAVHPLARLITELDFDRELPVMADVRLFAAHAPHLTKITFENAPTEPMEVPGFTARNAKTLIRA